MRCFTATLALTAARRVSVDGSEHINAAAFVSANGTADVHPDPNALLWVASPTQGEAAPTQDEAAPTTAAAAAEARGGAALASVSASECGLPSSSSCDMNCDDFYWRYCPDWEAIALSKDCFIPNANQICCDEIPAPCLGAWSYHNTEHLFCSRSSSCLRPSCQQEEMYLDHLYYDTTWRHLSTCIFESSQRPQCSDESAAFEVGEVAFDSLGDLAEDHLSDEEQAALREAEEAADAIRIYILDQQSQTVAPEKTPAVQSAAEALIARATATRADMANRDPDTNAAIQAKKDKIAAERAANGDNDGETGDMDWDLVQGAPAEPEQASGDDAHGGWDLKQVAQTLLAGNFTGVPGRAPTAAEAAALAAMQAPDLGDLAKRHTCQALADGRSLCRQGPYLNDCAGCLAAKQQDPLAFILRILRHQSVGWEVAHTKPHCRRLPFWPPQNAVEFADKSYCACESVRSSFYGWHR